MLYMQRLLAQGSYARVYIDTDSNEVSKVLPTYVDGFLNYHAILDLSIQKTFGGIIPGVPKISSYSINDKHIKIYMPFYGVCASHKVIPRELIPDVIRQLVTTLIHLEANGIQHTDIKPNNILFDQRTKKLTLIDYNMISHMMNILGQPEWCPSYGTWNFSAPEIVHYSEPSNTSSVWSVAFIMAYLYARYPLPEIYNISTKTLSLRRYWKNTFDNLEKLHPDGFPLSPAHLKCMPQDMITIFSRATKWNHSERMSLTDMFQLLDGGGTSFIPPAPRFLSVDVATNNVILKRIFNICRATRTKPVFTRAAYIFQQYPLDDNSKLSIIACAAHYIAVMLTGCYVLDDKSFIQNTLCYWDIDDSIDMSTYMIKVLNEIDWKIWGICPDLQNLNWSFKDLLENDDKVNAPITETST